jgi:hypothetical protein
MTQAMTFALAWLVIGLSFVYGSISRKKYSGFILAWALFLLAVFMYAQESNLLHATRTVRTSASCLTVSNIGHSFRCESAPLKKVADKMKINTLEAAKLLGIKPTMLRLLLRRGKIKAPPIVFDSETNSTGRMWSEDDIEQAREVLEKA